MKLLKTYTLTALFIFFTLASLQIEISARGKINLDYDYKADFLVFRPSDATWYGYGTESGSYFQVRWGISTDKPVPADYDGDGITDVAVFRPETSVWYIRRSRDGQMFAVRWGLSTDELVPADYDGDGQTDIAVWRRSDGIWYILTSTSGYNPQYFDTRTFLPAEIPVGSSVPIPADYDGDRKADFAVRFNGVWFIYQSETGKIKRIGGLSCDIGVLYPADYSGDGKADVGCVAFYPDTAFYWNHVRSQDGQQSTFVWGVAYNNDLVAGDDFDNDGRTDYAVYRNGYWWIYPSSTLSPYVFRFGLGGDIPAQWANIKWTR
jgi:hypothetical protein